VASLRQPIRSEAVVTLQNRVTPLNELVADASYRGTFMGNRGVLHDDHRHIVRWRNGNSWITCLLAYKGRRNEPMTPGLYTELFFLDEPTALAAGHRPCALCRRERFNAFRQAIAAAGGGTLSATELDDRLDDERRSGNAQRRHVVNSTDLPDGVMMMAHDMAHLLWQGRLFGWGPSGYILAGPLPRGDVEVLTPPIAVRALRGGFVPEVHPSLPT